MGGEVYGNLDVVEHLQVLVRHGHQAVAVGGDGQLDAPPVEVLDDGDELRMKGILARPHTHGLDGQAITDGLDLFKGDIGDPIGIAVTMGAIQVAIVGQPDANGEAHGLPLLYKGESLVVDSPLWHTETSQCFLYFGHHHRRATDEKLGVLKIADVFFQHLCVYVPLLAGPVRLFRHHVYYVQRRHLCSHPLQFVFIMKTSSSALRID
jgi:hypothetical protein